MNLVQKFSYKNHPLVTRIQWERHHLFTQEVGPRMVASAIVAAVLGLLFVDRVSRGELLLWFGGTLFVALNSWYLLRRSGQVAAPQSSSRNLDYVNRWHWKNLYLALIWGILWGAVPFIFLQGASDIQVLSVLMLVVVMCSIPSVTMGCYPDIYITFLTPVFFSFTFRILAIDFGGEWLPVVIAPLSWCLLVVFSLMVHRTYMESIVLRLEYHDAQDKAIRADDAKTRFLAAASHDLRQPLQAASLYLSAVDQHEMNDKNRDLLQRMRSSIDSTNSLLSQLLDVSTLDAQAIQPDIQVANLSLVLKGVQNAFAPLARQKNLRLTVATPDIYALFDPVLLAQVIRNLVGNSIKYTEKGSVSIEIDVRSDWVYVNIRDTGRGIAQQYHGRIFDDFYQLENPGRQSAKGVGLGLAIVKRLCHLQNIPLTLESAEGKGTCISLRLPLSAAPPQAEVTPLAADVEKSLAGVCVLLVDDDQGVLDAMSGIMVSWDMDVWTASGMQELNDTLASMPACPDVIITDDRLGGGERSSDVLARLQQACQDVAVVVLTGNTAPEDVRRLKEQGYPVLHKPVSAEELKTVLQGVR